MSLRDEFTLIIVKSKKNLFLPISLHFISSFMMKLPRKDFVLSAPIQPQYFPFLPSYMNYILKNASPELLLKFYQCCKYFYFKFLITITTNVWYQNYPDKKNTEFGFYGKNGIGFWYRTYPNIQKIWLSDKLHISAFTEPSRSYGLIGSEFLKRIYRNNLKKLSIHSGFTLFKELSILCQSPNLTEIELQTYIQNENGEPIPIEEIMILFPNVKEFEIRSPHFTMESFNKLSKFKFLNKIQCLEFRSVKTQFDPISLCRFLQENFDDGARLTLSFCFYFNQLEHQLLPQVKEIINGWETKKLKYFYS